MTANFTHRGMSYIRYDERGKGMADGGSAVSSIEDGGDEDYDYNLWHDFVGRNCEWDDDKDEDGGVGGGAPTNVTYGGVRGEVAIKARSGRTNPSSNKGSGSSTNKQRTANPPSTFEDDVDEGRDYIGSSRCSIENLKKKVTIQVSSQVIKCGH
ncbi:hypothetical protein Bca52824_027859 [Brassica carinata]|uniref:Uncharacterized protein n=1 Tax=Brassica carinata TaxID=52824 RepID=A0A8X7VBC0_BRACI|nr:hypothetical protein Bca52824_027859 [Brassica carinata]